MQTANQIQRRIDQLKCDPDECGGGKTMLECYNDDIIAKSIATEISVLEDVLSGGGE